MSMLRNSSDSYKTKRRTQDKPNMSILRDNRDSQCWTLNTLTKYVCEYATSQWLLHSNITLKHKIKQRKQNKQREKGKEKEKESKHNEQT